MELEAGVCDYHFFFVLQLSGHHAAQPHRENVFQSAGQKAPKNYRNIRIWEEQCRFHPAVEKWTSSLPRWFPWGIMGICSSNLHGSTILFPLESCGKFWLVRGVGAVLTVCATWSLYNQFWNLWWGCSSGFYGLWPPATAGRFSDVCVALGTRVSTSKSGATVLSWKTVDYPLWFAGQLLP